MKKELTLEQAIQKLDGIVAKMDDGGLSLEASLKLYEEGVSLAQYCEEKLQAVRLRVETLIPTTKEATAGGEPK